MTNRWLMGAAAAALTVAGAFAAQAADLPTRKEAPRRCSCRRPSPGPGSTSVSTPAASGPPAADDRRSSRATASRSCHNCFPTVRSASGSERVHRRRSGGLQLADGRVRARRRDRLRRDHCQQESFVHPFSPQPFTFIITSSGAVIPERRLAQRQRLRRSLSWLGTTRARVGFVATPDNRLMFYGTGGVAYGGGSGNLNVFDNVSGLYWSGSPSSTPRRLDPRRRRRIRHHQQHHGQGRISLLQPRQQQLRDGGEHRGRRLPSPACSPQRRYTYDGSIFRAGSTTSSDRDDLNLI